MTIKQVVVVRTDLNMRKGKIAAQVAHASLIFLHQRLNLDRPTVLSQVQAEWLARDQRLTVLQAGDEHELVELSTAATMLGIESHRFYDAGYTEIKPNTLTAIALGPDYDSIIDKITGKLRLL